MSSKRTPKERLFPTDFWDRPQPSTAGDRDEGAIFDSVGRALTTWECFEDVLSQLCAVFSGMTPSSRENYAFRRLFGTINSSSARRNAILAAAEVYFWPEDRDGSMMKKLEMLLDNASRASKLRDDIAHGVVTGFHFGEEIVNFLMPSDYKTDRNKAFGPGAPLDTKDMSIYPWHLMPGEYRYSSADVLHIRNKFSELTKAASDHSKFFIDWKATSSNRSA